MLGARGGSTALDGRARLRALPAPRASASGTAARSSPAASSRCSRSRARCSTNPTLLIMDEPSEGLAPAIIEHLIETFKQLERGRARDPADRAEPRRGDGDRRAPARDGRGLDRRRDDRGGAVAGPGAAAPLPRRRAARGATRSRWRPVVLARHARHEGRTSTRSCATGCASTASTCCSSTRASHEPLGSSRTSRATRSRARPAPTSRALAAAGDRGAAVDGDGARAPSEVVQRLHAEGRLDGDPRARRLGRLVDRDARDARAAGRRAEADGLDGRVGRHAPVRRRRRRDDDVLGRRHRRRQPRLGADHGERRRRDRGHGRRRRVPRLEARSRSSARRCSASRRRA